MINNSNDADGRRYDDTEIARLFNAATPGDWQCDTGPFDHSIRILSEDGDTLLAESSGKYNPNYMADGQLLAAAPYIIAELMAENEQLRAERDAARAEVERFQALAVETKSFLQEIDNSSIRYQPIRAGKVAQIMQWFNKSFDLNRRFIALLERKGE